MVIFKTSEKINNGNLDLENVKRHNCDAEEGNEEEE
jgi:hypothetical protein